MTDRERIRQLEQEVKELHDIIETQQMRWDAQAWVLQNAPRERDAAKVDPEWYRWLVEMEVHKTWVEDGFNLTDDRAHSMLAHDLRHAYGHELRARVVEAPDPQRIAVEQGTADGPAPDGA